MGFPAVKPVLDVWGTVEKVRIPDTPSHKSHWSHESHGSHFIETGDITVARTARFGFLPRIAVKRRLEFAGMRGVEDPLFFVQHLTPSANECIGLNTME